MRSKWLFFLSLISVAFALGQGRGATAPPATQAGALLPVAAVQPDSINFGSVLVDSSRSLRCTVKNTGTAPLHISSVTSSSPAYTAQCTPMTVPAQDSAILTITFMPSALRRTEAEITVASDDSANPSLKVVVRGDASIVQSLSPAANSINASDTLRVLVTFARAMDPSSISDSAIAVIGGYSGRHAGTVTYDGTQRQLVWSTAEHFSPGERVTAVVKGGLRTTQNDTTAPFQWSFSVAPHGGSGRFVFTNSLDIGDISGEVTTGDFDRDGNLDLAYSIRSYQSVYIAENHGSSGFSKITAPATSSPDRILSTDFDGDGYPEIATASGGGTSVTISKRQANGSFVAASTIDAGAWCGAFASGDIDGDGRPDLVFVGTNPTAIYFFRNLGGLQFQQANQIPYEHYARGISLSDLDGDGDLDLVLALSYYHTVVLYEHRSGFDFEAPISVNLSGEPIYIICADFDNDGDADVATLNRSNDNVSILRNDSLWHFTRTAETWVSYGLSFAAADYDRNGLLDIVASTIDGDLLLLKNNGSLSFGRSVISHAGDYYRAVAAGDFDNDGDMDFASTNGYNNTLVISRNRNAEAKIHLLTDSFDFRTARLDSVKSTGITIVNEGAVQPLQITGITSSESAFTVSLTQGTIAAIETMKVFVQFRPTASRVYRDTISIMSDDTTQPIVRFLVTGKGDQVITCYPMPYSYTASDTARIEVHFGVALDAATLSDSTVRVRGSHSGVHRSKSLIFDQGTRTLAIEPATPFHPGETVTIGLTTGIHTLPGEPVFLPRAWGFNVRPKNSSMTFRPVGSSTLPGAPVSAVLVDLDGDSLLDIVALSHDQPTLSILKNNGSLSFSLKTSMNLGSSPQHLAAADFDNDGDVDLVGPEVNSTIRFFRNDGNFAFTPISIGVPGYLESVTVGDYDGDGLPDLAVGTGSSGADFSYLRNKGNFTFDVIPGESMIVDRLFTADFDDDGLLDIADGYTTSGILRNEGNFSFSRPTHPPITVLPSTCGDFNRDGRLDFAGPYWAGSWYFGILLNKGDLNFRELQKNSPFMGAAGVTATDIDGDGFPDFLLRSYTGLAALHCDSALNLHTDSQLPLPNQAWDMAIGDLDNDGDNDLVNVSLSSNLLTILEHRDHYSEIRLSAARYNFGTVPLDSQKTYTLRVSNDGSLPLHIDSVLSSNPAFTILPVSAVIQPKDSLVFTVSFRPSLPSYYSDSLSFLSDDKEHPVVRFYVTGRPFQAFVDSVYPSPHTIQGPGNPIIVRLAQPVTASSLTDSTVRVFGALSGFHQSELSYDAGTRTLTVLPFRGFLPGEEVTVTLTGDIELSSGVPLISGFSWVFTTAALEGTASFSARPDVAVASYPEFLCPGDFNGDGIADLVSFSNLSTTLTLLQSQRWTGPVKQPDITVPAWPAYLCSGDFDADGRCDLIVLSAHGVTPIRNSPTGFITKLSVPVTDAPRVATVADLDADGDLDIAVASDPANRVTILWNEGNWTFVPFELPLEVQGPMVIRAGDFDADGDMDLLVAKQTANNFSILQNNQHGAFSEIKLPNITSYIRTVVLGDFDRDGDLDIASDNDNQWTITVLVNQGNLTFLPIAQSGVPRSPMGLTGADFDRDGDLDLAGTGSGYSSMGSIYLYDGQNFSPSMQFAGFDGTRCITSGDFDADGAIDIAFPNPGGNTIRWLHNNLNEGFTFSPLSIQFGKVVPGMSASSRTILRNAGTQILKIDSLRIRKGVFAASINKLLVAAGDTAIITVTFTPDSLRRYDDTLFIETAKPAFNLVILQGEGGPTSEIAEGVDLIPDTYSLFQNYPNPFNPATSIRYALPRRSQVLLRVYNSLGQLVETLVDETQEAGYRLVKFDGSKLASGIYFYRIQCGDFADTKKLLLLK